MDTSLFAELRAAAAAVADAPDADGVRAAALGAAGRVGNFDIEGGACAHRRFKTDRAAHQYRQRLA